MPSLRSTLALAAAAGLALSACSRAESAAPAASAPAAAVPVAAHAPAPQGSRPRLVFFMNPNGRPCQLQDQVLQGMAAELGRSVDVTYLRTTEAADLARFQEYGIRALPQLVVVDPAGREMRRATPGILGPEQVRALVTF